MSTKGVEVSRSQQLVMGDKVIMLKETGGQRYIALDRWYNPNRGARLSNGR